MRSHPRTFSWNVLKTSNNGVVMFLDTIESINPFNSSCSTEIFERKHIWFWLGVLYNFFQLLLMLVVCKKEDGQPLHNTNHVMDAHLLEWSHNYQVQTVSCAMGVKGEEVLRRYSHCSLFVFRDMLLALSQAWPRIIDGSRWFWWNQASCQPMLCQYNATVTF